MKKIQIGNTTNSVAPHHPEPWFLIKSPSSWQFMLASFADAISNLRTWKRNSPEMCHFKRNNNSLGELLRYPLNISLKSDQTLDLRRVPGKSLSMHHEPFKIPHGNNDLLVAMRGNDISSLLSSSSVKAHQ